MDIETIVKVLAPAGAAVAFAVGMFQWLDTRKREVQAKRFDQFHRAFEWVAGRTAAGQKLVDTQQAMATYELANFPEYREMSLPILEYYSHTTRDEADTSLFRRAVLKTQAKLARKQ